MVNKNKLNSLISKAKTKTNRMLYTTICKKKKKRDVLILTKYESETNFKYQEHDIITE